MKPRVSILSPDFKYVPAVATDVANTFARIRREQCQVAGQQGPSDAVDVVIGVAAKNGASTSLRLCDGPNHASKGSITGKRGSDTTETEDSAIVRAAGCA
jgi:hypothetical protein